MRSTSKTMRKLRPLVLLVVVNSVTQPLHGQTAQPTAGSAQVGTADVWGFGGVYWSGGASAGSVGGGFGYTVHRHLRLFGEVFYLRKDLSEEFGLTGLDVEGTGLGVDGGAQFLFPIRESKAVPFATIGAGVIRASASVQGRVGGRNISVSGSESAGTITLGGGLDYDVSDNWGIRPEFRLFRGPDYRATLGVFYRF